MDTTGTYPKLSDTDPLYEIAEYTRRMSTALDSVYPPTPETRPVIIDNAVGRTARAWDAANNRYQMIYGDTGWRSVEGSLPSGITNLGPVYLRRLGNEVFFVSQGMSSNTAGNIYIYLTPSGFKPEAPSIRAGVFTSRGGSVVRQISPYQGGLRVLEMPANTVIEGGISYITSDPWPTSLPGTTAGVPA